MCNRATILRGYALGILLLSFGSALQTVRLPQAYFLLSNEE
jgi:hypothetical protein